MTQRTETAARIASVYCFRCPIAQRFHAVVLTSARVPIFGVFTLNVGQVSFVAFVCKARPSASGAARGLAEQPLRGAL